MIGRETNIYKFVRFFSRKNPKGHRTNLVDEDVRRGAGVALGQARRVVLLPVRHRPQVALPMTYNPSLKANARIF